MEITFADAAKGANKEMSINIEDACPRCDGNGSEPGTKVSHCHYCNGTGMVSFKSFNLGSVFKLFRLFKFSFRGLVTLWY